MNQMYLHVQIGTTLNNLLFYDELCACFMWW